jgi:hypothetical protein
MHTTGTLHVPVASLVAFAIIVTCTATTPGGLLAVVATMVAAAVAGVAWRPPAVTYGAKPAARRLRSKSKLTKRRIEAVIGVGVVAGVVAGFSSLADIARDFNNDSHGLLSRELRRKAPGEQRRREEECQHQFNSTATFAASVLQPSLGLQSWAAVLARPHAKNFKGNNNISFSQI